MATLPRPSSISVGPADLRQQRRQRAPQEDEWETIRVGQGQEDEWETIAPAPMQRRQKPEQPGAITRFGRSFAGSLGVPERASDVLEGPAYAVRHPIESAKLIGGSLVEAHKRAAGIGLEKLRAPGLASKAVGAVQYLASGVPIVGPALVEAGEQFRRGDIAGGTGTTLGISTGLALGTQRGQQLATAPVRAGLRVAERIRAPMRRRLLEMPPAAKAAPAERFTRAEVMTEARRHGVEMTPAQATQYKSAQTLQAVGERSLLGGGKLNEFLEANRGNLLEWSDDLAKRIDPKGLAESTEATGLHLKQSAQVGLDTAKKSANAAFSEVRGWTKKARVDVRGLRERFGQELADISEALANEPAQYATPVRKLLEKVARLGQADEPITIMGRTVRPSELPPAFRKQLGLEGADSISFSTAQRLRSDFWDMGHDFTGTIPNRVQAYARQVTKELDTAMERSARSAGPEVYQGWRDANAQWKQLMETYQDSKSPLYRIMKEPDPVKVPQKLLETGAHGGSARTVRMLNEQGFDLNPLRVEVLNRIRDRNFTLSRNRLAGFSDEFLRELFSPAELRELYILSKTGRNIRFEVNPSGTSNVHGAMYELHGIARGAAHIPFAHGLGARLSRGTLFREGALGRQFTRTETPTISGFRSAVEAAERAKAPRIIGPTAVAAGETGRERRAQFPTIRR